MTRPNILVRADTIDLQDASSPHAADHGQHINAIGIAPHQASQYQHVVEERHSEEQALADAWNMSATSNGDAALQNEHDNMNDVHNDGADGTEGDDGEQDADDDLIDRISSSPSIDEGELDFYQILHDYSIRCDHAQATFNSLPQHSAQSHGIEGTGSQFGENGACVGLGIDLAGQALSSSRRNLPSFAAASLTDPFSSCVSQAGEYSTGSGNDIVEHEGNAFFNFFGRAIGPARLNAFAMMSPDTYQRTFGHDKTKNTTATPSNQMIRSMSSVDLFDLNPFQLLVPGLDSLPSFDGSPGSDYDSSIDTLQQSPDQAPFRIHAISTFDPLSRIASSNKTECLQLAEDIDFEFVYALHTFVATVEGQANATKGDTMVLLDDSNSYWWLVRVVKDSSIGYLPAEHIETPTERLARLNKHRNIDLSQAMLGDNPEKSRNPLKMAMRRRNAKTVQFAAPTYVEASDYEYSDDEEQPSNELFTSTAQVDDPAANGQPIEVEERNAPEEANVHATRRYSGDQASIASKNSFDSTHKASFDGGIGDDPQLSPKLVDRSEAAPLKSRKGTPRNTDSFLKDDSIETRKITLTPGLLRDDSGNTVNPNPNGSKSSSMDSQRNTSMESLTKVISPTETSSSTSSKKDGKDKKKEKNKGGMLSGLFKSKKKDKKGGRDDDGEDRTSMELARGASPQNGSSSPVDRAFIPTAAAAAAGRDIQVQARGPVKPTSQQTPAKRDTAAVAELEGSDAAYEMIGTVPDLSVNIPGSTEAPSGEKESALSPVTNLLKSAPKAKRSKQRVELDDFDSPDEQPGQNPFDDAEKVDNDEITATSPSGTIMGGGDFVHIPTTFNDNDEEEEATRKTRANSKRSVDSHATDDGAEIFSDARENTTSPSGMRHEPATIQPPTRPAPSHPPAREGSTSTVSGNEAETPKSSSPTVLDGKQSWDDGALRAWLDAEEVKDMLTIVHASARADGPIAPVPNNHPLMQGLYVQERGAVDRMMSELDGLLMGWAGRKGIALS